MNFWFIFGAVIAVVVGLLLNATLEKFFEREYKFGILSFFDYNARDILRRAIIVYYFVFIFLLFLKFVLHQISFGIPVYY